MNIKWHGATLDPSGYGNANRDYIKALSDTGVNIQVAPWNFEANPPEFYGSTGILAKELERNTLASYDMVIHHYVPNKVEKRYESGKINIGYSTWEAESIPNHWVEKLNTFFDAQIVPSQYNKKAYERSGVKIPIHVVPHCIDTDNFAAPAATRIREDIKRIVGNRFVFLSVFQWIERKNPMGLLKAYLTAFRDYDEVILVIKTYGIKRTIQENNRIFGEIQRLKESLRLKTYPKIYMITDMLTRKEMVSLYQCADCFVLPTRAEGFGIPFAEAAAAGTPIVATNYSGQIDFLTSDFADLCKWQPTPICDMELPHYTGDMLWAEPNIISFKYAMYDQWSYADITKRELKANAKKHIQTHLSYKCVGKQFKDCLEQIQNEHR